MYLKEGATSNTMLQTLDEMKLSTSHFMSMHLEKEGFSPLVGRLFTLLLFSAEPLCLQQMAEALSVSKAAISVQIRNMVSRHLCNKVPVQNDRKDYYYITDDFEIHVFETYKEKIKSVQQTLKRNLLALPEQEGLDSADQETCRVVEQRFSEISLFCDIYMSRMKGFNEEWLLKKQLL
ncbi:GbsR/MarR family transcriptional regulator [Paenibacillus baimaensis]|nr:hypothetical protein [Paenibacillus sp. WQ 127069]